MKRLKLHLGRYLLSFQPSSSIFLFSRLTELIIRQLSPTCSANLCNRKNVVATLLLLAATIASSPSSYQAYKEFLSIDELGSYKKSIATTILITTLINLIIKNAWSADNIIRHLKSTIRNYASNDTTTPAYKRQYIKQSVNSARSSCKRLGQSILQELFNSQWLTQQFNRVPVNKAHRLLHIITSKNAQHQSSNCEYLALILGGVSGLLGAYYAYPLAKTGSAKLLSALSCSQRSIDVASPIIGFLAYTFNASLLSYTCGVHAKKTHRLFTKTCCQPSSSPRAPEEMSLLPQVDTEPPKRFYHFFNSAGLIVAAFGGAPMAQMTYENINIQAWYAPPVIIAAFFALSTTKYWAIKGSIDDYYSSSDQKKFNQLLRWINNKVETASEDDIDHLYSALSEVNPLGSEYA